MNLNDTRICMACHHPYLAYQTSTTKRGAKYLISLTHPNAFVSNKSRSGRKMFPLRICQDHRPMARARVSRRNQVLWMTTRLWTRLPATSNRATSLCSAAGAGKARANVGVAPNLRSPSLDRGTSSRPLRRKSHHLHPGWQWSHELNTVGASLTSLWRTVLFARPLTRSSKLRLLRRITSLWDHQDCM